MKKFITIAVLVLTTTAAQADIDHQAVINAPGKSATDIISGFQMALGGNVKQINGTTIVADSQSRCLINKILGVSLTAYGEAIIEAKEGKYRVIIQNTTLEFRDGISLQVHKPGNTTVMLGNEKTWHACQAGFDQHLNELHNSMMQYQTW